MTVELFLLPKTRAEAFALGSSFYFTGKPCKHGHLDKRHVRDGCRGCCRAKESARAKTPLGKARSRAKGSRYRKTEHGKTARALQEKKRLDRIRADPVLFEAYRGKQRERKRRYNLTPSGRAYLRRKSFLKEEKIRIATPKWCDKSSIDQFVVGCPAGHHVDHIIPLRGKFVWGLNIPENLQYLPATENLSKSNKVDPLTLEAVVCVLPAHRRYVKTPY